MSQKPNQDAKNIGARFRSARSLVPDLNRKSFCERHGINRYTMQSWENGLHVSKGKNVEKFIEALAREGVYCTTEWLIEGVGESARPLSGVSRKLVLVSDDDQSLSDESDDNQKNDSIIEMLTREYAQFNETLLKFELPDDVMAPKFLTGDIVLGRLLSEKEAKAAHQKYCIIELGPDRFIVRKVICLKEGFMLLASDERLPSLTLNLQSQLYQIVWHLVNQ